MKSKEKLYLEDEHLSLKLKTENNSVDANVLIVILQEINKLMNEINNENKALTYSDIEYEFKINAIKKGSFEFEALIIPFITDPNLFENVKNAISYVSLFKDLLKLKKIFKDKELPESVVNNTIIHNNINTESSNITINQPTYNIYIKEGTQESISNIFGKIDSKDDIIGVEINTKDSDILTFDKDEFSDLNQYTKEDHSEIIFSHISGKINSLKSKDPEENNNIIEVIGLFNNIEFLTATATLNSLEYIKAVEAHKNKKTVKLIGKVQKLKTKIKFITLDSFIILN
jgi:hypothetical protein